MSLLYIIDGYNVLKHSQFAQQILKKANPVRNTEVFRQKNNISNGAKDSRITLLEFIKAKRLCGSSKNKITVVFDGYPDTGELINNTQIEVIFTRKESADERIKKIVEATDNAKTIMVVSDDKEIQFIVRSFGARCIGVEDFLARSSKKAQGGIQESQDPELTYSQMETINRELRKLWLK